MASSEATRRRRLVYLEKGASFKIPKSTLSQCKKVVPSGNQSATAGSPVYNVPSDGDELESDWDSCSSDPQSRITAEGADSSESNGEETMTHQSHADSSTFWEKTERPPQMSEEHALVAGLRAFGTQTLPHSTTTKAAAVAMIMAFVAGEALSWQGLDNLLLMVNAFFAPEQSVLPQSKYLFRKLFAAEAESAAVRHFYCRSCNDLLEVSAEDGVCPTCETSSKLKDAKKDGAFFVVLDIGKQLNHVIQNNKAALHEKLNQIASDRGTTTSVIGDITQAKAYKNLQSSGTLRDSDLTLTVNTDGSPVFTSSGASVWPIQFTVNELPVPQRFQVSVLAGLWFGKGHPNMTLCFGKFVEGVKSMQPVPASMKAHSTRLERTSCAAAWMPPHAHLCRTWSLRFLSFEDARGRTSAGVLRDMKVALESSLVINGYKGPSPAVSLPDFDLVWGFTVEYMHGVLLGVIRQITEMRLSSLNSNERFYIGSPSSVAALDRRLLSIRPPHCVTRLPRSLATRTNWKASEWRHWLLYYCLPCTLGILHPRYWSHLAKLVEGVHLLLREELTSSSIDPAGIPLDWRNIQQASAASLAPPAIRGYAAVYGLSAAGGAAAAICWLWRQLEGELLGDGLYRYGAWIASPAGVFSVLSRPYIKSGPDVAANDVAEAGVSCCCLSRSWRLAVEMLAKSTGEGECRGLHGVPTAALASMNCHSEEAQNPGPPTQVRESLPVGQDCSENYTDWQAALSRTQDRRRRADHHHSASNLMQPSGPEEQTCTIGGQTTGRGCCERLPDLAFTCRQRQQSLLTRWAPALANGVRQSRSDSRDRLLSHRAGGGFRGGLQTTQKEHLPEATRPSGTASIRKEKHRRACACLGVCVGPSVWGFSKSVDSLHQLPKRGKNAEELHHLPLGKEHPEIASAFPNFEHHVNAC
ncbi:hypothetical protein ISCGN_002508 [Ixodes scapularis]